MILFYHFAILMHLPTGAPASVVRKWRQKFTVGTSRQENATSAVYRAPIPQKKRTAIFSLRYGISFLVNKAADPPVANRWIRFMLKREPQKRFPFHNITGFSWQLHSVRGLQSSRALSGLSREYRQPHAQAHGTQNSHCSACPPDC